VSRAKRTRKKENARAAREARAAALKRQRRKSAAVRVLVAFVVVALIIAAIGLFTGGGDDDDSASDATTTPTTAVPVSPADFELDPALDYSAKITTNFGQIEVALDSQAAPVAAGHFIKLAKERFYDGLTWHRASKDFVIQGGDPAGDGTGGSGAPIVGEVPTDNYPVGSLAAAKTATDPPGTFDSQFYIVTGSQGATLPNEYARFGSVVTGLEVAKQIESLAPAEGDGAPTAPATIDKVEIIEKQRVDAPATTAAASATTATGG
jgi:peptidyl-prolyl cis-trans isomerase B (cyclophilin B)